MTPQQAELVDAPDSTFCCQQFTQAVNTRYIDACGALAGIRYWACESQQSDGGRLSEIASLVRSFWGPTSPLGEVYERDEPTASPLPEGVEGFPVGGRAGAR